jgi:hypothetical protein
MSKNKGSKNVKKAPATEGKKAADNLAIQLQYQKLDTMESYRTFISFIRKLNT